MRYIVIIPLFVLAALYSAGSIVAQCPLVKVSGPAGLTNAGDNMTFRAEINVVGPTLGYFWKVDKGTITEGQGTPKIVVVAEKSLAGESLTATVHVSGIPSGCENIVSETAGIAPMIIGDWELDSWGRIKPNEERARLDTFFVGLLNASSQVGLVILRITRRERLDPSNDRIQFILRRAKFRKLDKKRLWFALERADERRTILGSLLPTMELPCGECILFKGESL